MKKALISVSDKTGIVDFALKLIKSDYEILSTGGTYSLLKEHKIPVTQVSEITGFPEIMDGRVKTLHPKIHGGILCIRDDENHLAQAEEHKINLIDMLVINLYPFKKTVENPDSTHEDIIENIDIGGPSMLRAGAKNYKYVTVLTDPDDYESVLNEIAKTGNTGIDTRFRLAQKVFTLTAEYDTFIANTLKNHRDNLSINLPKKQSLRYGENPHQSASYFQHETDIIEKLHGKELSYNNLLDIDAALKQIMKFKSNTVAILKHLNPCGVASDNDICLAYDKAFATDTVSPFGGIVVTNAKVSLNFVEKINKVFTEILIAPDFEDDALQKLKKKKDRRIIKYNQDKLHLLKNHLQIQACLNGYLTQDPDSQEDIIDDWVCPTKIKPTDSMMSEFIFAWNVVKMLKSNAICITKNSQTLGMGIGQTSRIDSMNIAINKAKESFDLTNAVCASDGFFPFRDSIDSLHKAGVRYVIQPGGSKADNEVITACDEHSICMILTGKRHFRH